MARFEKGRSGNPGGRPREIAELRHLVRQHTETAVTTLAQIMADQRTSASARIAAATALLDRGYGRPAESMEVSTKNDGAEPAEVSMIDIARRIAYVLAQAGKMQDNGGEPP